MVLIVNKSGKLTMPTSVTPLMQHTRQECTLTVPTINQPGFTSEQSVLV